MNVDDLIATAQHRTQEVLICARGDLVDAHAEAVRALAAATEDGDGSLASPEITEAARRVQEIEEEQAASTVTFVLSSVSRRVWADLLAANAPTDEQRRAGHDHNPDTFPVAAVAACAVEPSLSLQQAEKLIDVLPAGEWSKLWVTALHLNISETPHPKLGAATELLRANGRSSTTSDPAGSLEAGSLAGSGKP